MLADARERAQLGATPAARLLAALVLVGAIATAPVSNGALGAAIATALMAMLVCRTRGAHRALLPAGAMIVASVVPLGVTSGLEQAARIGLRALAAVTTAVAILSTLSTGELAPALRALGAPSAVAAVVAAALRQTAVLGDEGRRLLLARRLRGPTSPADGAAVLGALLARAAARAERIELAMSLRGYSPEGAVRRARLVWQDVPLLLVAVSGAIAIQASGRLLS